MQKEQSLFTRMHSVQLFALDDTQRLTRRQNQHVRNMGNQVNLGMDMKGGIGLFALPLLLTYKVLLNLIALHVRAI